MKLIQVIKLVTENSFVLNKEPTTITISPLLTLVNRDPLKERVSQNIHYDAIVKWSLSPTSQALPFSPTLNNIMKGIFLLPKTNGGHVVKNFISETIQGGIQYD